MKENTKQCYIHRQFEKYVMVSNNLNLSSKYTRKAAYTSVMCHGVGVGHWKVKGVVLLKLDTIETLAGQIR